MNPNHPFGTPDHFPFLGLGILLIPSSRFRDLGDRQPQPPSVPPISSNHLQIISLRRVLWKQ